jgi:hypothetical protein
MTAARHVFIPLDQRNWSLDSVYAVGYEQRERPRRPVFAAGPQLPDFPDEGCDLAPRCLECPIVEGCRYDLPPKRAAAIMQLARLRQLFDAGASAREAATATGMSLRNVFRLTAGQWSWDRSTS